MKNILVLNDFPIYPPTHGGKIRIYNIYRNLSKEYSVNYICFTEGDETEKKQLSENFFEIKVPKSFLHKNIENLMCLLLKLSVDDIIAMLLCKYSKKYKNILDDYIKDSDIVILAQPYMFPVVRDRIMDKFLIYDAQNVEYTLKRTILGEGLIEEFLYNSVKEVEGELVRSSKIILAPSATDIDHFKLIYKIEEGKIYLAPNGADLSLYGDPFDNPRYMTPKVSSQPLAIFIGSAHPPNIEAANIIIDYISPKRENVFFLICGTVCWGIKNKNIPGNVGLAYDISDEEKLELYRHADIALNPMVSGSGTNIKMLEYMAAGLPIVTTAIGARGLDIEDQRDAVICEISEFPDSIEQVIDNSELRNKLISNSYELVKKKYDWKKISDDILKIIEIYCNGSHS